MHFSFMTSTVAGGNSPPAIITTTTNNVHSNNNKNTQEEFCSILAFVLQHLLPPASFTFQHQLTNQITITGQLTT
jgi:hypothetical protein